MIIVFILFTQYIFNLKRATTKTLQSKKEREVQAKLSELIAEQDFKTVISNLLGDENTVLIKDFYRKN